MTEPKITFGPDYAPPPSSPAIDLTVVAEEIRKSVTLGFEQARSIFMAPVPQPQAPAQVANIEGLFNQDPYETPPGTVDLEAASRMTPTQREAYLARFGLMNYQEPGPPPDPTHQVMEETIRADGNIPPGGGQPNEEDA